jgi:hypothetical protein
MQIFRREVSLVLKSLSISLLALIATVSAGPAADTPPALFVGAATADISPPVGYRVSGGYDEVIAKRIDDPLFAKALVLRQGGTTLALEVCDLTGVSRNLSEAVRAKASRESGIPVAHIAITATHTHGGPLYYDIERDIFHRRAIAKNGTDPNDDPAYFVRLVDGCVAAIVRAAKAARPARAEVAVPRQPGLAFNRRYHMKDGTVRFNPGKTNANVVRPAGPTDDDLPMLLFHDAADGKPFASLTVFAMHVATANGPRFGADFPGYLQARLRELFGNPAFVSVFGEGTAGDVNHIHVGTAEKEPGAAQIGAMLAQTIAAAEFKPLDGPALATASTTVEAPLRDVTPEEVVRARSVWEAGTSGIQFLEQVELYRHLLVTDLRKRHGDRLPMEVQTFRLNDQTAVVLLPHEVFVELGLVIRKASPFKHTFVVTLSNDVDFYIPTRKAFGEGSYEVTNSAIKPGGGELLVDAAVRLLRQLHESGKP